MTSITLKRPWIYQIKLLSDFWNYANSRTLPVKLWPYRKIYDPKWPKILTTFDRELTKILDSVTRLSSNEQMFWHMSVFTLVKNLLVSFFGYALPLLSTLVCIWNHPFGKQSFWGGISHLYHCVVLSYPFIPVRFGAYYFRAFVMAIFSLPILWKTFPTSFNNERTRKEFLSSSSRFRRKPKIKRRRTRRIKFWRTFASFSLTTTKFNTRSCKYPCNFCLHPPIHPIFSILTRFWPFQLEFRPLLAKFWWQKFLGSRIVGNFWTNYFQSKRFDGIKFWKFDKFFERIEFIIENDFAGTSFVTIESCWEENNRCIWFFGQSSNCKLETRSKCIF